MLLKHADAASLNSAGRALKYTVLWIMVVLRERIWPGHAAKLTDSPITKFQHSTFTTF